MASLYFTVTTDLSYDQRMARICTTLAREGYQVTLVGRQKKDSIALEHLTYSQVRLYCFFEKGKAFYAEYNIRLFFFLLFKKMDGICAIDLDTIAPCYWISVSKKIPRIYDAHELFCEMKEIVRRPYIYKIWKWIEKKTVPHFNYGYTVNDLIAGEFKKMYKKDYEVVRNIAVYREEEIAPANEKFILYQGAVNEGRCFETLIPAMQYVDAPLVICGSGNYMKEAKKLVEKLGLQHKITFKGMLAPDELREITRTAYIGLTLFDKLGLSNYYSLANRFFDYLHSGVPQLCVDYPVYREINNLYEIAVLLKDTNSAQIADALNDLLQNENKWQHLHVNCKLAAKKLNWQQEEKKLVAFYKNIFG